MTTRPGHINRRRVFGIFALACVVSGVVFLAQCGCTTSDGVREATPVVIPQAVGRDPTAKHPIVRDVGHKGSYAVFGGKDGTKRTRITWPKDITAVRIGPNGQVAAACCAGWGRKPRVVFYDTEGKEIRTVTLPRAKTPPGQRNRVRLYAGDRGEAIVWIGGRIKASRRGEWIDPASYYISGKGEVRSLNMKTFFDVSFRVRGGGHVIVVVATATEYELRRFDPQGKPRWRLRLSRSDGVPLFLPPNAGADITMLRNGKLLNLSTEGKPLDLRPADAGGTTTAPK